MTHNYLITGGTGFIGQHILFEVLNETLAQGSSGRIYMLIRKKEGRDATQVIRDLLQNPAAPDFIRRYPIEACMAKIKVIECDLRDPNLNAQLGWRISHELPLQVFHSAGSVNLHSGENAAQDVRDNNYLGTQALLTALKGFKCRFMFVSTAFASGMRTGLLDNDFLGATPGPFRNPYEASKADIEAMVHAFGKEHRIPVQIARPSVVMGRLLDAPYYVTSKFDVLYGLARFFWAMGKKKNGQTVRLQVNPYAGLNILPVDYVAKACVRMSHTTLEQLNIVHSHSVPHVRYLTRTLDRVGFKHYDFVEAKPTDSAGLEKAYYRSVGTVFDPYLNSTASEFDTTALQRLMNDVPMPDILAAVDNLIGFAIEHQFDEAAVAAIPNATAPELQAPTDLGVTSVA